MQTFCYKSFNTWQNSHLSCDLDLELSTRLHQSFPLDTSVYEDVPSTSVLLAKALAIQKTAAE